MAARNFTAQQGRLCLGGRKSEDREKQNNGADQRGLGGEV